MTPAEFAALGRTARAADEPSYRAIVADAAARFRSSGRHAFYFARGKLNADPVFAALLRDGRIASGNRVIDIGCGIGVMPALLAAAEQCNSTSTWPLGWAPPPHHWTLHGFDLRSSAVATGQRALADLRDRVSLRVSDARIAVLPACDVVVMLDVLHYIDADAQRALLDRVHATLRPGGTVLVRVADAAPTWRFHLTLTLDWLVSIGRGTIWPRLHCRPLSEWTHLLETLGFSVTTQAMSEGTPFANVLLIATKATSR